MTQRGVPTADLIHHLQVDEFFILGLLNVKVQTNHKVEGGLVKMQILSLLV